MSEEYCKMFERAKFHDIIRLSPYPLPHWVIVKHSIHMLIKYCPFCGKKLEVKEGK